MTLVVTRTLLCMQNTNEWEKIFDFFKDHPIAMASFATKYVNEKFLSYNSQFKVRIRYSLMPQKMADIHEKTHLRS